MTDSEMKMINLHAATNVISVERITVIKVVSRIGKGIDTDPVRWITEYYSDDGQLLARVDDPKESSA